MFFQVFYTFLDDLPDEINRDKMWVIAIPDKDRDDDDDGDGDGDDDGEDDDDDPMYLKYDIIYDHKGNDGPPIRLDPKIQL